MNSASRESATSPAPGLREACRGPARTRSRSRLEYDLARVFGRSGMPLAHMRADVVLAIGGDGTIAARPPALRCEALRCESDTRGRSVSSRRSTRRRSTNTWTRIARGTTRSKSGCGFKVTVDGERMFDCTTRRSSTPRRSRRSATSRFDLAKRWWSGCARRRDLVATPTGSTSYSMSAGGRSWTRNVEAIIVTAIAPFKPASRPHVFPAAGEVHIRLRKPKECLLVMDGQHESTLKGRKDVT